MTGRLSSNLVSGRMAGRKSKSWKAIPTHQHLLLWVYQMPINKVVYSMRVMESWAIYPIRGMTPIRRYRLELK